METETAAAEHKAALQWTLQHWDSKRPCFRVLGPIEVTSKSITRSTRVFTAFGAYIAASMVLVVGVTVSLTAAHVVRFSSFSNVSRTLGSAEICPPFAVGRGGIVPQTRIKESR
jgi:hypothetical protein